MSDDYRFPYLFAPTPNWVFDYVRDRTISQSDGWLLNCLYKLANVTALRGGREVPINLDTLLEYADPRMFRRTAERRRAYEALRKRVERGQKRGLFSYIVQGNATTGYRYLFRLPLAAPVVSVLCPTKNGSSRPTPEGPQEQPAPSVAAETDTDVSETECGPSLQSCPTSDEACPTAEEGASQHHDLHPAGAGDASCPSPLDLRDNNKPSTEGNVDREGSSSRARAHDAEPQKLVASTDRMLALIESGRGLSSCDYPGCATLAEYENMIERLLVNTFDATLIDSELVAVTRHVVETSHGTVAGEA